MAKYVNNISVELKDIQLNKIHKGKLYGSVKEQFVPARGQAVE